MVLGQNVFEIEKKGEVPHYDSDNAQPVVTHSKTEKLIEFCFMFLSNLTSIEMG